MLHLCHLVPSPLWGRRGSQVEGWCGWLEYQGQEKHVLPLARKPADDKNIFKKLFLETSPIYYVLTMYFKPLKIFQLPSSIYIHIRR
jgi:hypothetical protein